jgi:hypothetical protein
LYIKLILANKEVPLDAHTLTKFSAFPQVSAPPPRPTEEELKRQAEQRAAQEEKELVARMAQTMDEDSFQEWKKERKERKMKEASQRAEEEEKKAKRERALAAREVAPPPLDLDEFF